MFLRIIKEMSNIADKKNMNLHEECLIKYLINPLELFYATELLKSNNLMLEKDYANRNKIANYKEVNYNKV